MSDPNRKVITFTIASGTQLSEIKELPDGSVLSGLIFPAAWDAATFRIRGGYSQAATVVSDDATTAEPTVVAGQSHKLNVADWAWARYIQFESVSTNQTADRTITAIVYRPAPA